MWHLEKVALYLEQHFAHPDSSQSSES